MEKYFSVVKIDVVEQVDLTMIYLTEMLNIGGEQEQRRFEC